MAILTVEFPEALTAELEAAVEAGWFENKAEAVSAEAWEFVSKRRWTWLANELTPGMMAAESEFVPMEAASVISEVKARKQARLC